MWPKIAGLRIATELRRRAPRLHAGSGARLQFALGGGQAAPSSSLGWGHTASVSEIGECQRLTSAEAASAPRGQQK